MTPAAVALPEDDARLPAGAAIVMTEPLELAHALLRRVVESATPDILQVVGPPGAGKTTAVDQWCEMNTDVEVVRIALGDLAKGYEVLRELLEMLGYRTDGDGLALRQRAVEALRDRRVLIYIDEADMMNRAALRQFRYLYDYSERRRDAAGRMVRHWPLRFGLVLVGSDFSTAWRLAPDLRSRVDYNVRFGRIPAAELKSVLRTYHPVFAKTPASLLRAIDAERCAGAWRAWRKILGQILADSPDAILITDNMAARVLGVSGAAA